MSVIGQAATITETELRVTPAAAAWHLVRTAISASPRRAGLVLVLSIGRGLLPLAVVTVLAAMVDQVARLVGGDTSAIRAAGLAIGAQAGLQVGSIILLEATRATQRRLELLVRLEIERHLMVKLIAVDVQQLEGPRAFARVSRLRSAGQTAVGLMNALLTVLVSLVTLAAMLIVALRIHPVLSAMVVVIAGLLLTLQVRAGEDRFHRGLRVQSADVRASYWLNLLTNPLAALDIRAYQLGPWIQRRWEALVVSAAEESSRAGVAQDRVVTLLQVVSALASLALSVVLLWLASERLLTVGSFVATGAVLLQTVAATQQLGQSLASAVEGALGHADLLRFGLTSSASRSQALPARALAREIEAKAVTFQYVGAEAPTIRDVSFTARCGERILFVGPNGAGKSTFLRLLAGLYPPGQGRLLYDGIDLKNSAPGSVAASLLQGYIYYDTTVSENIALGDVARSSDRDAVVRAAQDAQMDQTIMSWPQQYDHGLGRWLFADGVIPSQGQRVRLALARTLFRDATLYLLDEPTAGLDPEAARAVAEAIGTRTRGRTAIIVSHDLDLWSFVDRVVVFERGRIVADGPHSAAAEQSTWLRAVIGADVERSGAFDPAERPYWS